MFQRFTDRSRKVVVLAQEEARRLSHNYIGTEHLLLGLLHKQSGIAAVALESAGITLDAARVEVVEMIGLGKEPPSGHIPFTPRAKKVLELSLREALELKKSYIGSEHILLGLTRERDGVGAQVLERLGPSLPVLRQRVIAAAEAAPGEPGPEDAADDDDAAGAEAGLWSWPPRLPRAVRSQFQTINEFREFMTSIDRRLARIERHLGIAGEEPRDPEEPAQ